MPEVNNNSVGGNITNYSVSGSRKKIYHSSKEPKPNYVPVELKDGTVTYIRTVDALAGNITYLAMQDGNFGKKLKIFLSAEGETSALQVSVGESDFRAFIDGIFNVDFSKYVQISFYEGKSKTSDKKYQNCYVSYPDELVEVDGKQKPKRSEFLDKTNCPPPVERRSGWDFGEQEDWYYEKMEQLLERWNKYKNSQPINKPIAQAGQVKTKANTEVSTEVETSDDLPF